MMPRLLFALLLCLPAPLAGAAEPERPPETGTVLHLAEQAERQVPRDRLHAVLRVEVVESDAAKLQAEINRRMTAALARAKGVAEVSVATGGYSLQQEQLPNQPRRWRGVASLSLTARDPAPLLDLVGALQQEGLVVSSLAYELTPEAARQVEDELTATAVARLKERAEHVAASLGLAVERFRDLRLGNAGIPPQPRVYAMAGAMASASANAIPPPVAEPGEATVSISVDADVVLKPKP